jgi:branched-chain amino acid transport system substrate-binding protein
MKLFLQVAVLVCLALPISTGNAQDKVKLGVVFGDSATTADGIPQDLLGVRLAVEDLNRQGGLLGKSIDLVEYNNHNLPIASEKAAMRAVGEGVIAVIGPASSSHALLVAAVLQNAGVPMISTLATNPEVTRLGDYIFRVCFSDTSQGKALANFAVEDLKAKTAVVLTCIGEKYSLGLAKIFMMQYRENGGTLLWEGEYFNSATDFKALLEEAAGYGPDVIFLPGYNRASGFIIRQGRNMGLSAAFLGGDAWTHDLYRYGGDAIKGSCYSGFWHPDPEKKISRAFLNRYEDRFQREDIISFGLSHDAVFLLADAVRRAGSLAPSDIRDALAETEDFQGVTGKITMDQNGDPTKPVPFYRFENGKSVFIKLVAP